MTPTIPVIDPDFTPPEILGMAALTSAAFAGRDLNPVLHHVNGVLAQQPADPAALMDLSILQQLSLRRDEALVSQAKAIAREPAYRLMTRDGPEPDIRLLALVAAGDFMANSPVEFILDGASVGLDLLYVGAGQPLPDRLPPHDVALVAIGESAANQPILAWLARYLPHWPRPVLNDPNAIAALSRDGVEAKLAGAPGIRIAGTARADRDRVAAWAGGGLALEALLPGGRLPILIRPLDSHAGKDLVKIDAVADLPRYLADCAASEFYLTNFIDYAGPDGLFRKYRIAVIGGQGHLCHLAISSAWMVHYLNAGMTESAEKRAEEAHAMAAFATEFGARQGPALAEMTRRLGLDYYVIDCAETRDGALLLFEADIAMVIHAMDPPDLFPYKRPQMMSVFAAFQALLRRTAAQAVAPSVGPSAGPAS